MSRTLICIAILAFSLGGGMAAEPEADLAWTNVRDLRLEGKGWPDTRDPYDRLPAKAEAIAPLPVWNLSRHSAGMHVRFVTDAPRIHARWSVGSSNLAMPHMAATGVSGLDLYVKTGEGEWRWLAVGRPVQTSNQVSLISGLPAGMREFLLYLPLYNSTRSVELGIPSKYSLSPSGPWGPGVRKPIVFYGTSILHGACASRPGMVHSAILGRRYHFPHINLGFSGNGRMESVMADLMAELDPSIYVLDCLPNMTAEQVRARVEPFVQRLRQTHPSVPIVLVEDRTYADSFLVATKRDRNDTSRVELKSAYQRLRKAGVKGLYYLKGDNLLGKDGEGTVDSSHPNDLGFMRQANAFGTVMKKLLKAATRD